ncbi:MAG: poly-gamma-glutamate system protein [Bradymonadia bacterium]
MKALYWRGRHPSLWVLLVATCWMVGSTVLVERWPEQVEQSGHAGKIAAAEKAKAAFEHIKGARGHLGVAIDARLDPQGSGLIGAPMSPVTSNSGHLPAKQTSINPNFAAVIYGQLQQAGVERGDLVAVGVSGSFPALNICTYAALETLGARPLVLASASASQFGANLPELMWLDMERVLADAQVLTTRASGASLGGIQDQALGMDAKGRALLKQAMARNNVPFIGLETTSDRPLDLKPAVDDRIARYRAAASGQPIKAYINVGGSTVSLGGTEGRRAFKPGLNADPILGIEEIPGVMARFAAEEVPVIHLAQVEELARLEGLPLRPQVAPAVGEGGIYIKGEPRGWLAVLCLIIGIALLVLGDKRTGHTGQTSN